MLARLGPSSIASPMGHFPRTITYEFVSLVQIACLHMGCWTFEASCLFFFHHFKVNIVLTARMLTRVFSLDYYYEYYLGGLGTQIKWPRGIIYILCSPIDDLWWPSVALEAAQLSRQPMFHFCQSWIILTRVSLHLTSHANLSHFSNEEHLVMSKKPNEWVCNFSNGANSWSSPSPRPAHDSLPGRRTHKQGLRYFAQLMCYTLFV